MNVIIYSAKPLLATPFFNSPTQQEGQLEYLLPWSAAFCN